MITICSESDSGNSLETSLGMPGKLASIKTQRI